MIEMTIAGDCAVKVRGRRIVSSLSSAAARVRRSCPSDVKRGPGADEPVETTPLCGTASRLVVHDQRARRPPPGATRWAAASSAAGPSRTPPPPGTTPSTPTRSSPRSRGPASRRADSSRLRRPRRPPRPQPQPAQHVVRPVAIAITPDGKVACVVSSGGGNMDRRVRPAQQRAGRQGRQGNRHRRRRCRHRGRHLSRNRNPRPSPSDHT